MNEPELNALFVRFRDGHDPRALAQLFDQTAPRLLALAARLVREPADAEDVVQTTFLAAIAAKDRFDAERPILGWLVGILQKQAAELHRKSSRVAPRPAREESTTDEPLRVVLADEEKAQLRSAITELPPRDREVIDLAVDANLGPNEIARRLGRTPGAIRVQMFRAIERLRELMPAGLTASVLLLALEKQCLASVRSTVLATPAATTIGATGGLAAWKLAAALVVAGSITTAIVLVTDSGPTEARTAGEQGIAVAQAPTSTTAVPLVGVSTIEPVSAASPQREAVPPPGAPLFDSATQRLTITPIDRDGIGVDLDQGSVVPHEQADVIVTWDAVKSRSGKSVAVIGPGSLAKDVRVPSDDAFVRAITSIDPAGLAFTENANLPTYKARKRVFAVLRGTSLFAFGVATARHDGTPKLDLVWRRVARHAAANAEDVVHVDSAVLADDWFGRELERRRHEYLAEIDAHANFIAASVVPIDGFLVRACAFRETAGGVTIDDSFDYVSSTYSFEHDTRDDVEVTHNDWELAFTWRDESARVRVRTVVDDRGSMFELGDRDPSEFDPKWLRDAPRVDREGLVQQGMLYLVETIDTETQRYDLMQVLNVRSAHDVVFRYRKLDDASLLSAMRAAIPPRPEDAAHPYLTDGNAHVQMRAGAGGGNPNQAFFDGSHNMYVHERSDRALDLSGTIDVQERARVYVEGGRIPEGRIWRITQIEWFATTAGDFNGPGAFRIVVGKETLASVEQSADESRATWNGEITLKPGDEQKAFVEIRNSSRCDVRVHGVLIDAPTK